MRVSEPVAYPAIGEQPLADRSQLLRSDANAPDAPYSLAQRPIYTPGAPREVLGPRLPAELRMPDDLSDPKPGMLLTPPGPNDSVFDVWKDYRSSFFQRVRFTGTWIDRGGSTGVGFGDLELDAVFALPFFTVTTPLLIRPGYAARFLDVPASEYPLLPDRLNDAFIEFRHLRKVGTRLGMDVGVSVGWYSDYETGLSDSMRIMGHGIVAWEATPHLRLVGGAKYLDRDDIPMLPIGGFMWRPNPRWRFDLVFPQPKIARRFTWFSPTAIPAWTDAKQDWLYLSAELGGGTWSVERTPGASDMLNYRDYRINIGFERWALGMPDLRCEVGYVFSREFEFKSDSLKYNPANSVMLRFYIDY